MDHIFADLWQTKASYWGGSHELNNSRTAHLHAQISLPELAICCATSHGTKEELIDLNDLLN
jgi:hypothetical protein